MSILSLIHDENGLAKKKKKKIVEKGFNRFLFVCLFLTYAIFEMGIFIFQNGYKTFVVW